MLKRQFRYVTEGRWERPALALIFAATLCWGQAGRAELFGTIQDPSGLPVPNVKVETEDQATAARYASQSNARGEYHILGVPAGEYVLTIAQPGFRTYRQSGIILRLDDRTSLDVKLQIGQLSQSVEVRASAPLLQTASGEVSLNENQTLISTLPLDGRNFIPLVTLSPGVALPNGQFLPRINGSRPRTNEYNYDGISVLQPEPGQVVYYPIIDGMEEFKLNVNAYSPEYGRSNGGTVMVIGKSGSNDFHGSLFEFFRNEALNARNLFAQPGPKLTLTADDLAKLPRASVRTTSNGLETVYEGVWVYEVLKEAGVPQGSALRGKALASYVLAEAQDGYQVVFSLAELDLAFIDNQILLADTANGKALFGAQGRFRLIVPKDKPGARSIRMLTKLEVVQLKK